MSFRRATVPSEPRLDVVLGVGMALRGRTDSIDGNMSCGLGGSKLSNLHNLHNLHNLRCAPTGMDGTPPSGNGGGSSRSAKKAAADDDDDAAAADDDDDDAAAAAAAADDDDTAAAFAKLTIGNLPKDMVAELLTNHIHDVEICRALTAWCATSKANRDQCVEDGYAVYKRACVEVFGLPDRQADREGRPPTELPSAVTITFTNRNPPIDGGFREWRGLSSVPEMSSIRKSAYNLTLVGVVNDWRAYFLAVCRGLTHLTHAAGAACSSEHGRLTARRFVLDRVLDRNAPTAQLDDLLRRPVEAVFWALKDLPRRPSEELVEAAAIQAAAIVRRDPTLVDQLCLIHLLRARGANDAASIARRRFRSVLLHGVYAELVHWRLYREPPPPPPPDPQPTYVEMLRTAFDLVVNSVADVNSPPMCRLLRDLRRDRAYLDQTLEIRRHVTSSPLLDDDAHWMQVTSRYERARDRLNIADALLTDGGVKVAIDENVNGPPTWPWTFGAIAGADGDWGLWIERLQAEFDAPFGPEGFGEGWCKQTRSQEAAELWGDGIGWHGTTAVPIPAAGEGYLA